MDEKNEFKIKDENLTQKVIDPSTGKDITGEYVNQRLRELEKVADEIIQDALKKFQEHEANKVNIYQKAYWEIHNKLGMGSIGPATAAAVVGRFATQRIGAIPVKGRMRDIQAHEVLHESFE